MKKKKAIIKYVHERLFNADIILVICPFEELIIHSKKCLNKEKQIEFAKMLESQHDKHSLAHQYPFSGGASLIWSPTDRVSILLHEIVHAAHHLLEDRTVPLTYETEEVYAYLIEFLFKTIVLSK